MFLPKIHLKREAFLPTFCWSKTFVVPHPSLDRKKLFKDLEGRISNRSWLNTFGGDEKSEYQQALQENKW